MKLTYFATAGLVVLVAAGVYLVVQNDTEGRMQEMQATMKADFDRKFKQQEEERKEAAKAADETQRKLKEAAEVAKAATGKTKDVVTGTDPAVENALNNVKNSVLGKPGVPPGTAAARAPGVASEPPNLDQDPEVAAAEARAKRAEQDLIDGVGVADRAAIETARLTNGTDDANSERLNDLQSLILAQPRIAKVGDARAAEKAGFVVLDEGLNKGLAKGDRFAVRRGTIIVARIAISDNIQATRCVADVLPKSIPDGMSIKTGDDIIKFDR